MITKLKNPFTESYLNFKELILSNNFPWFYNQLSTCSKSNKKGYINTPFYNHAFLARPDSGSSKYPRVNSDNFNQAYYVLNEIFDHNNIHNECFIRISANSIEPVREKFFSIPHIDHNFPHKNIILYFTSAGGKTFVGDEFHDPKEDDIIMFDGLEHYLESPIEKRRIVLVATFINI